MVTIKTFYKCYQMHHHRAKAITLMKLLDDKNFLKAEDIIDPRWGFSQDDYERMLKIELRTNLFHAIETMFTLYFCLQPNDKGKVDDFGLFKSLNKRNFYYEQIKSIAKDGNKILDVLDSIVEFDGKKIKFGQYLFYYAFKQEKFPPGLDDSLEAIKHALHLLSIELSDTAEYNSYKHALRSIPAISEFAFAKADTLEIVMSFDAKNSMTYFQEFKKNGFSYNTKVFDTNRDFRMTLLASNLIYNIIMFRRASIVRDLPEIPLSYFVKENVDACAKRGDDAFQFSNTFKPFKD